jgi:adenosylhomocysteine nucleosidase
MTGERHASSRHHGGRRILVVAALHEEVGGFTWETVVTGPGKLRAAFGLSERLRTGRRPDLIVNVGTAGSLHGDDASWIGAVHEPTAFIEHDFASDAILALTGRRFAARIEAGPGVVIATGDQFVTSPEHAARLQQAGADLVDMEAFAYAHVAGQFGVPFRCAKFVTDAAGPTSVEEWKASVGRSATALGVWLGREIG